MHIFNSDERHTNISRIWFHNADVLEQLATEREFSNETVRYLAKRDLITMKTRFILVILILTLLTISELNCMAASLPNFTQLAKTNSKAVVNISSIKKPIKKKNQSSSPNWNQPPGKFGFEDGPFGDFFRKFFDEEGRRRAPRPETNPGQSLGSGFIVSPDGYVITNHHVVTKADEVIVRLLDRREYNAKVIGSDRRSDIAVLKIEAKKSFPTLKFARPNSLQVGEWVLAIGSPFGFDYSVTAGIVSAKGRNLPRDNYVPFIQTDVAINPGNSGGPLFNLRGEVVGVNSQIYSRTGGFMGLSFAIPIDVVLDVYNQLREKGSVTRGWLGVLIQDVTQELAESFGMDKPRGALIAKTVDDGPAENSGLEVGDIITKFGGKVIERSSDLPPLVGTADIGKKVMVEVVRDGSKKVLSVEIGELPVQEETKSIASINENDSIEVAKLGLEIRDLTDSEKENLGIESGAVLIDKVLRGPAYEAGLRRGDLILKFNNENISNSDEFRSVVKPLKPGNKVPILIKRRGGQLFIVISVPEKSD